MTRTAKRGGSTSAAPHALTDRQIAVMQAECQHTAQRTLPDGRVIQYTLFVQWGDDSRYTRCRHCGKIEARGLSAAATTPAPINRKRSSRAADPRAASTLWDMPQAAAEEEGK